MQDLKPAHNTGGICHPVIFHFSKKVLLNQVNR